MPDGSCYHSRIFAVEEIQAHQYYLITAIYNKSTAEIKLYVNGILRAKENVGNKLRVHSNAILNIGKNSSSAFQGWNGELDDIRIYNRAISKSEIQQLYHYKGCQPSIDIKLNSNNRVTGDKVVINAQIKGPGNSDSSCEQTQVEQKVWIKLPDDSVIPLIAPFTVLTLLPGDDIESKIFECTFSGASPIGSYQIGGRLLHPFSGDTISTDIEVLTFSQ